MNKVGLLLDELHDAQTDLAAKYRATAGREAAEQDVYYLCHTLAEQTDAQAEWTRSTAHAYGKEIAEPRRLGAGEGIVDTVREKASHLIGRRPESGIVLLRDLRQLYMMAEGVNIHWIMLGQVAQALRNHELLSDVSMRHKQTLTQIKWLKTKIKESTPQTIAAGQPELASTTAGRDQ
jgi:hypothetical protein